MEKLFDGYPAQIVQLRQQRASLSALHAVLCCLWLTKMSLLAHFARHYLLAQMTPTAHSAPPGGRTFFFILQILIYCERQTVSHCTCKLRFFYILQIYCERQTVSHCTFFPIIIMYV